MKPIFLLLCVVVCCGCFAHARVKAPRPVAPEVTGTMVDAAKLRMGGRLGLAMFKAGPQAEANEQLDHISLLLLKGIRDRIGTDQSSLTITENARDADFVMEGHIERFSTHRRFGRPFAGPASAEIAVSGEVWERVSGKKILTFASSRKIKLRKGGLDEGAYRMGDAIGRYILGDGM